MGIVEKTTQSGFMTAKNMKLDIVILVTMLLMLIAVGVFFLEPRINGIVFSQVGRNNNVGEILSQTEIIQEIPINRRKIYSVDLMFGTYVRRNTCDIDYGIYSDKECKELLYKNRVNTSTFTDNSYSALKIECDTSSYEKVYLKINSPNSSSGNAVTIWSNKDMRPNTLWVNNVEHGAACMRLSGVKVFYIPVYLKMALGILTLSGILIAYLFSFSKEVKSDNCIMCFYIAFVMFFCFFWSLLLEPSYAPDEWLRLLLPDFIFRHNELPVATNNEVSVGRTARLSYAYYVTWFPAIVNAAFMKVVSIFTTEKQALLHAARFASVVAAGAIAGFAFKISKELFDEKCCQWIFILIGSFLPQFIFLGSYVNNDIFAVLASAIIFYAWVKLENKGWVSFSYATLLAVGIIIAILSYYNGYMWVLCSCYLYCCNLWKSRNSNKTENMHRQIKTGIYIAVLTTVIVLPFFIRNLYLYDELFGLKTFGRVAIAINEENNIPPAPKFTEKTIFNFSFWSWWIKSSAQSFFANFGHMIYILNSKTIYKFFYFLFGVGILGAFSKKCRDVFKRNRPFNIALFMCAVTPLFLSGYFTWNVSFQAQGRYLYPGLLSICYFVVMGLSFVPNIVARKMLYSAISIALIIITTFCGTGLILSSVMV